MLSKPEFLILGLGNLILGDEGVGIHIVNKLKKRCLPEFVRVIDGGTMGMGLVDAISGYRKVLVVDAVRGKKLPDLKLFSLKDVIRSNNNDSFSLHGINFGEVLKLMDALKMKIPEITVLGIRINEIKHGIGLSGQCQKIVSRATNMVLETIENYRRKHYDKL